MATTGPRSPLPPFPRARYRSCPAHDAALWLPAPAPWGRKAGAVPRSHRSPPCPTAWPRVQPGGHLSPHRTKTRTPPRAAPSKTSLLVPAPLGPIALPQSARTPRAPTRGSQLLSKGGQQLSGCLSPPPFLAPQPLLQAGAEPKPGWEGQEGSYGVGGARSSFSNPPPLHAPRSLPPSPPPSPTATAEPSPSASRSPPRSCKPPAVSEGRGPSPATQPRSQKGPRDATAVRSGARTGAGTLRPPAPGGSAQQGKRPCPGLLRLTASFCPQQEGGSKHGELPKLPAPGRAPKDGDGEAGSAPSRSRVLVATSRGPAGGAEVSPLRQLPGGCQGTRWKAVTPPRRRLGLAGALLAPQRRNPGSCDGRGRSESSVQGQGLRKRL